jgi:uncharacterized membrane protein YphA (DoxX/SURF4 family)
MTVLTAVMTLLTALVFLAAGWVKFAGEENAMEMRDSLGFSPAAYRAIGACEVAGAVGALAGLAFRPLGIAALSGLVLVSIAAIASHVRLGRPASESRAAVIALVLSTSALVLQILTA